MDITFETQKGTNFTIEVGYWDTIAEVKAKVQKYKEIPVSQQTLIFKGRILDDDINIERSELVHRSRVRLIIAGKNDQLSPSAGAVMPPLQFTSPPISRRIQIILRLSTAQKTTIEIDLNDMVERLKEKINEIEGISIPINRIVLHALGNIEMQDRKLIRDYNLVDGSEVGISVRPGTVISTPPATMASSSRKMRIFVLPHGANKIIMEVNVTDKIQVIRNELEMLKQRTGFELPAEGYFFIYNQNVMEEKQSFLWHRVRQGDTIEMFNGSVSGGS